MLAVAIVYLGFIAAFVGGSSLLKPLAIIGIHSRRRAASLVALGCVLVLLGAALPAKETRVTAPRMLLDQFMPAYQFHEYHSIRIAAPRERVYTAVKSVTADEILLFRTLTAIRRLGRPGPESILNAPEHQPLLEVATKTSFLSLAEEANREIVVGTIVGAPRGWRPSTRLTPEAFKTLHEPGFALAGMNFFIEDDGTGACTLTTETRVYATDVPARRRFARYWRVIYPGSALIRRMWLRAIARRALSSNP